jgi:hypothetical protein
VSHEAQVLLRRALPLLVALGDYVGNGPVIGLRGNSLGLRCDLIADIRAALLAAVPEADRPAFLQDQATRETFLGTWARKESRG